MFLRKKQLNTVIIIHCFVVVNCFLLYNFNMPKINKINGRLRKLRRDKEITQASLGSIMNVKQQTINQWEHGITEPDLDSVVRLALIFGVTTDYLLGAIDDMHTTYKKKKSKEDDPYEETVITGNNKGNIITGNKISDNRNRVNIRQ